MALLDVGCGPGTITVDLAGRLDHGSVVGIDQSADVIAAAIAENPAALGGNLQFAVGNVYQLDFPDESFDVVFAHQILQHLGNPLAALEEMRRVVRIGGMVAIRDADFGAFTWSPPDPLLDRWRELYHEVTRRNGANADAGRALKGWVRAAGLENLVVTSSAWVYETDAERAWWGGLWADRVVASDFARHALEFGLTTAMELAEISAAFRRWTDDPNGVFIVPSGEVIAIR